MSQSNSLTEPEFDALRLEQAQKTISLLREERELLHQRLLSNDMRALETDRIAGERDAAKARISELEDTLAIVKQQARDNSALIDAIAKIAAAFTDPAARSQSQPIGPVSQEL